MAAKFVTPACHLSQVPRFVSKLPCKAVNSNWPTLLIYLMSLQTLGHLSSLIGTDF